MQFTLRPKENYGPPCADFYETQKKGSKLLRADILHSFSPTPETNVKRKKTNSLKPLNKVWFLCAELYTFL